MTTVSEPGQTEAALPDRIGPYEVVARLAKGGMAELLLGRRLGPSGFSRTVAIKRILPHYADEESFRSMFLDEARLAAMIQHPNVVRVEDLGEDEHSFYMAMEYLEGETVRAVLRELGSSIDPILAAFIVAECAAGLHAAHSLRSAEGDSLDVVHRDVTPHNVFITYEGRVKVIDFGVARASDRITSTRSGVVKGKFAYMSPEQLLDQTVDHRSDQFSLGIVLHELLTRRRLFNRSSQGATVHAIVHEPVPPPSKLNPGVADELDAICARALAKHPVDRFRNCEELRAALMAFAGRSASGDELRAAVGATMQELFPNGPAESRALLHPSDISGIAPRRRRAAAESAEPEAGGRRRWLVVASVLLGSAAVGGALAIQSTEPEPPPATPEPAPSLAAPVAPIFIEVDSDPPGAAVVFPGEVGLATPARIERPPSDETVTLRLRLDDHRGWSRDVSLDVSQRIHATLAPEQPAVEPSPEVDEVDEVDEPSPMVDEPRRRRRARRSRREARTMMAAIPLWD